jgi:hypothetical protein
MRHALCLAISLSLTACARDGALYATLVIPGTVTSAHEADFPLVITSSTEDGVLEQSLLCTAVRTEVVVEHEQTEARGCPIPETLTMRLERAILDDGVTCDGEAEITETESLDPVREVTWTWDDVQGCEEGTSIFRVDLSL